MLDNLKIEWIVVVVVLALTFLTYCNSTATQQEAPNSNPSNQQKIENFAEYPKSHTSYKLNEFQCYKQAPPKKKIVDLTKVLVLNDVFGDPRESPTQNVGTLRPPHPVNCHGESAYESIPDQYHSANFGPANIEDFKPV